MNKGTDLSVLYSLRNDFTIIALTGRTGSGAIKIAEQINMGFSKKAYPHPSELPELEHDSHKKYQIVYKFAEKNIPKYTRIYYRDIITLFVLKYPFNSLIKFLQQEKFVNEFNTLNNELEEKVNNGEYHFGLPTGFKNDFNDVMKSLKRIQSSFDKFYSKFNNARIYNYIDEKICNRSVATRIYNLFFSKEFSQFSQKFHEIFKSKSVIKHHIFSTLVTNNIRRSGQPFRSKETDASNIFEISKMINLIIKVIRSYNGTNPSKILIDSLRNPFEIMFFKQRYSAFYILAVNREAKQRDQILNGVYKDEFYAMQILLEREYKGGKGKEFFRPYLRSCIEKADIHISFRNPEETAVLNNKRSDNTSPYYSWQMQLIKYLSLIEHPGLVTPSPEERCMQLAYSAKFNSGCISRQVGAAITDENYSIKAIGWNDVPEGQVPCLLRDAESLLNTPLPVLKEQMMLEKNRYGEKDLMKRSKIQIDFNLAAFTPYEKTNSAFKKVFEENYRPSLQTNKKNLKGRNVCICFKTLQNSCVEGKNQVHTRSLHAEESAFLQITKYGGMPIKNGKLFTTASPCELCSKKAYQLGKKVIYYVDPYPGISEEQILDTGSIRPEIRLFNGAIGSAYHWLFEPFMAYKDELSIILGQNIKDKLSKMEDEINLRLTTKQNKK